MKCGQPTPSKKRKMCDNCLPPYTQAARKPEAIARRLQAVIGRKHTTEARAAIATSMEAIWQSPEHRALQLAGMNRPEVRSAISESKLGKSLSSAHKASLRAARKRRGPFTDITKSKMSEATKLQWKSSEHRAKMSKQAAQLIADGIIGFKGLGKQTRYTSKAGIEYTFRSTWELKTAEYFDAQDVLWEYEIIVLTIDNESYLPDFVVLDEHYNPIKIVEVKGWFPPDMQAKLERFQDWLATQGIPLEIWNEARLNELGIL